MRRYVIERDLPAVGSLSAEQLNEVRNTSNVALGDTGPGIQGSRVLSHPIASTATISPRTRRKCGSMRSERDCRARR
jgi:hypothetical protein